MDKNYKNFLAVGNSPEVSNLSLTRRTSAEESIWVNYLAKLNPV